MVGAVVALGAGCGAGGAAEPGSGGSDGAGGSGNASTGSGGTGGNGGIPTGGGNGGTLGPCVGDGCTDPDAPAPPNCGDGILTPDEACDDANRADGDGCAANCLRVEVGFSCATPGEPCVSIAVCGDGAVSFPEACDDGGVVDADGCSGRCKLELGYKCDGSPSVCTPTTCGDGVVEGAEGCDDGNTLPFDGCSSSCQREPTCAVGPCTSECGDGLVIEEACDDGNTRDGDGCSSSCEAEPGYTCTPAGVLGDTMDVPIVYRDLRGKNDGTGSYRHPDFHTYGSCGDWMLPFPGLVEPTLDEEGKPVWTGLACHIESQQSFGTWFRDGDHGRTFPELLTLTSTGDTYVFEAPLFFPVDGRGWVAEAADPELTHLGTDELPHNFLFTSEVRYWFQYDPAAPGELTFFGDDDVWVFVAGKLAIDLGGTHAAVEGSFVLNDAPVDAAGDPLGLEPGRVYEMAVFHAERNPTESSYKLELRGFNPAPSDCLPECGDGIVGVGEQCDDGVNAGGYGKCGPGCQLGAYCGDGVLQMGEDCDDGNRIDGDGCDNSCRHIVVE